MPAKTFSLNNGIAIPTVGFGTWKSKPDDAYASVKAALGAGYRHIDTAFVSDWISTSGSLLGFMHKESRLTQGNRIMATKLKLAKQSRTAVFLERRSSLQLSCKYIKDSGLELEN
jgi:diketogulonate reductase-like aldo/keto reductase